MHWMWKDVNYAFRGLRKQPAFATVAVVTLALGIGSATTIFSVIQNVLLDPFPYTDAKRVIAVQIHNSESGRPGGRTYYQAPEFLDLMEKSHVFEEVIGGTTEDVLITNGEGTEQFVGALVTANMFRFLGVPAMIGRGISPEDAKPGAPPVFVAAYKMWAKRFNFDRNVVGQTFILNGVPSTLVGVMPVRFTKQGADLWRPVVLSRSDPDVREKYFNFQARLKPGISMKAAEADLDAVAHNLSKIYPSNYPRKFNVTLATWLDNLVGEFRGTLYTMAAAVGLLLLIACSNVANMLLARATAREKEMAVRAALGASRGRVIAQLLTESLLLAIGGAVLGCALSYVGIKALVAVIPDGAIPREAQITLNVPALVFSLSAACLTALLFGLAPALQAAKRDIVEPLKDSGKGVSGGFRKGKLRNALVVLEVALSLVLLVGAGLLMRTFVALQSVDLGFNPNNVLVARLPLPKDQYRSAAAKQQFFRTLIQRLQGVPGVTSVAETSTLPPYGGIRSEIEIPGKTHSDKWDTIYQLCSDGYFATLQLRVLRGRILSEGEVNDARKVAVINQTFATKYFGKDDPIGHYIKINGLEKLPDGPVANPLFQVIGVVSNAKNQGIQEDIVPEMFLPYTVTGAFSRGILVRTATEPLSLLNTVRKEIWAVDRGVALTLTGSLQGYLRDFSYSGPRFSLILLAIFAAVGLILVAIGVFSVIAYTVSRQTHEIGVRIALGAAKIHVMRMVLTMGLQLIAAGVVLGVGVSFLAVRMLKTQLWQVSPHDPVTIAAVIGVVLAAGVAACFFPARRATRVDPIVALRYE